MVDGYGGYQALFDATKTTRPSIELGCWMHARKKFFDLFKADQNPVAIEALERIAKLYAVEAEAKAVSCEARKQMRLEKSLPILKALHTWLTKVRICMADGSTSAKAIDYTLKRWDSLVRYAGTGDLPIDNNAVENVIRPIAIGKKNWLFVGSERAGKRAAVIQTLFGTAKLNGINPEVWLKDVLEKLPTWPNSRIDELLPLAPEVIAELISDKT